MTYPMRDLSLLACSLALLAACGDNGGNTTDTASSTTAGSTGGTGNVAPMCASNADCASSANGKICDTSTGLCVVCLATDDQCPQGQFCDPTTNKCKVGCTDASDCNGMGADLLCLGEMGIANTTPAAAIAAALAREPAATWTGPGTGLDAGGVSHKAAVIEGALERHRAAMTDPLEILRHVGGRELAAMGVVLLDG